MAIDRDDILRRALAAHFRYGGTDQPSASSSAVEKRLVYVAVDQLEDNLPPNDDLSAVRSQLGRVLGEINGIHNRADLLCVHLARSGVRQLVEATHG